jgi:hypothetical protein
VERKMDIEDKANRLGPSIKRYQFISWFPSWQWVAFIRFKHTGLALIYEWSLMLGFWEVRKWRSR